MNFYKFAIILPLIFVSATSTLWSAESMTAEDVVSTERWSEKQFWSSSPSKFFIDSFKYKDRVYAQSQKTQLGDQLSLTGRFRYQYDQDTFAGLGFETDPWENPYDSKTSKFEILLGHQIGLFVFQLDLDLGTDEGESGGTALGPDKDSEGTFIQFNLSSQAHLTFYPFNFDGEVGNDFNTRDVARIYSIEGGPDTLSAVKPDSADIIEKTIPGLVFTFTPNALSSLYFGTGVASYLYPSNAPFDILTPVGGMTWETREDWGYKMGYSFNGKDTAFEFKFSGHNKPNETGSLLRFAHSYELRQNITDFWIVEAELVYTQAGPSPYHLSRNERWFERSDAYLPVYTDYYDRPQDWIGAVDHAWGLKAGYQVNDQIRPYLSYRYQGPHFIFKERESAHLLRTFDDSQSHGGLERFGMGAYIKSGQWEVKPEIEYMKAQNYVFGNSSDVREDRYLSEFKNDDTLISIEVKYNYENL